MTVTSMMMMMPRYLKQSISSVYRDDLAELRQLRSSWELRGVKRLIEERRQKQINISRHRTGEGQQALTISTEFLDDWWTRNRESSRRGLRIVTGVGNHSKDFKPSLLPTIKSYLNNNNWKFRELYNCFGSFDGSIRVSGKRRN
ncbi:hypothetical protein BY996DRAFT_3429172 [Phakopsora pachyrhizi]|nr:hypothetical protein BY996DRAFT_3429172 [Phakopsora pachyrhizi]